MVKWCKIVYLFESRIKKKIGIMFICIIFSRIKSRSNFRAAKIAAADLSLRVSDYKKKHNTEHRIIRFINEIIRKFINRERVHYVKQDIPGSH